MISDFSAERPARTLPDEAWLETHFSGGDLKEILTSLEGDKEKPELAERTVEKIRSMSPLSLASTLSLVREGRTGCIRDALRREYRFTSRAQEHGDFDEGVRAKLVDKDGAPRWSHDRPEAVTEDEVNAMLAPPDDGELELPEVS